MRRCARITKYVQRVGTQSQPLPTYEGIPNLEMFLTKLEELVTDSQQLSMLEFAVKATRI